MSDRQARSNTNQQQPKCKPRFKGIENFLKRIAFNLGNSPSQTEVKIISCIPIDVTDLQHKIVNLEREMEGYTRRAGDNVVNMALGTTTFQPNAPAPAPAPATATAHAPPRSAHNLPIARSIVPLVCPTIPEQRSLESSENMDENVEVEDVDTYHVPQKQLIETEGVRDRTYTVKRARKLSPRPPKCKKRDRCKPQLIYYAQQATNSPFHKAEHRGHVDMSRSLNHRAKSNTYLQDVMRKQYRPTQSPLKIPSISSVFSSPVCRDEASVTPVPVSDLDACSCCRGFFHNIDSGSSAPYRAPGNSDNNIYYDTSMYDMVPVKEKSYHSKIDEDNLRKREHFRGKESQRYPDRHLVPLPQQYLYSYHNATGFKDLKSNIQKKTKVSDKISTRQPSPKFREQNQDIGDSSDGFKCTFDCGGIYAKPEHPKRRPPQRLIMADPPPAVSRKNAECLTISVNNTECQTASSKSVQLEPPPPPPPPEEDKTEATLNQIKTILQTVLTEVKTNSQVRHQPEDKVRKDATVQKGVSHSDMQACSSFMNSYTYSPYNMEAFMPSCSRQVNGSLYCPGGPGAPFKCLQNYPLFIQTTGRQCTCCYKNIPGNKYCPQPTAPRFEVATAPTPAPAAVRADTANHRSKETEKLIQEIYKSLTLNMEGLKNVTSTSENTDPRSSSTSSRKTFKFSYVPSKRKQMFSNTVSTRRHSTSSTPPLKKTTFGSEVISNTASMRSRIGSGGMVRLMSQGLGDFESKRETPATTESERERERGQEAGKKPSVYMVELPNGTTTGESSDAADTTDTPESEETVVVEIDTKKKYKSGLFSKMARLFKPKSKRQKEEEQTRSEEGEGEGEGEKEEASASDSDEYQTIYSQQSKAPAKRVTYEREQPRYRTRTRTRPRSRASHSRYFLHRAERRASPYLEQEYRRRWAEGLAFHAGHTPRYSSPSSETPRRAYYRNYEARAAYVTSQGGPGGPGGPGGQGGPRARAGVNVSTKKGLAWLRKHKPACTDQWKRLILEG